MTSLVVLVFRGQGPAYRALHLAGTDPALEVLEIIPLGDEAQILVKGPKASLEKWRASSAAAQSTLIEDWDPRIERAFYSLESSALREKLVFIEGTSLGEIFLMASKALQTGWEIVDLKIPRGSVKWGTLIVTNARTTETFEAAGLPGLQVTPIENPSASLRQYFEMNA